MTANSQSVVVLLPIIVVNCMTINCPHNINCNTQKTSGTFTKQLTNQLAKGSWWIINLHPKIEHFEALQAHNTYS